MATADEKRIEQIEKDLQDFRKEIGDLTKSLKAFGEEKVEELQSGAKRVYRRAAERAQDVWDEVSASGQELRERAGEHYDQTVDYLGRSVRRNPLQTLGIVAGVGFLIGYLSRR